MPKPPRAAARIARPSGDAVLREQIAKLGDELLAITAAKLREKQESANALQALREQIAVHQANEARSRAEIDAVKHQAVLDAAQLHGDRIERQQREIDALVEKLAEREQQVEVLHGTLNARDGVIRRLETDLRGVTAALGDAIRYRRDRLAVDDHNNGRQAYKRDQDDAAAQEQPA